MPPAPGVPVVVIRSLAAATCIGPAPDDVVLASHWTLEMSVVPAVSVELAAVNLPATEASPSFQSVAVVMVVVTLATTARIKEFAGSRFAELSVVAPPVDSVIDSEMDLISAFSPLDPLTASEVPDSAAPRFVVIATAGPR